MNLGIMVREEFVEIFKNSKSISTLKEKNILLGKEGEENNWENKGAYLCSRVNQR